MLKYTDYLPTPQIHLPCPDTAISSYVSYPSYSPPEYIVHKLGIIPPVPLWLTAVYECTPEWGVIQQLLIPPPPGDITTPCPPHVSPSSPLSLCLPNGETPPGPSTSPFNHPTLTVVQQKILCHIFIHHPMDPHCCSRICQHPQNNPPVSALFSGYGTLPDNRYCYS